MNSSDNSSEFDDLLNDPEFQTELEKACMAAFKRYPDNPYDSWEDLAHDVFIRCKSSLSQYRKKATTKTYLYKIAINLLIDAHRKADAKKRPPGKGLNFDDVKQIPDESDSDKQIEYQLLLKEILEFLNPEERRVIVEWGLKGRRLKEMADELGITAAAMSIRLHKILTKIRRLLK